MSNTRPPDHEALRLELQEGIASFRHITTLMMQMVGIIVAADVLLVSYGISQRVSAILLIASFTPVIILIALFVIFNHAYPIIIAVMRMEDQFSLGEHSLANTYTRMRMAPMYPYLRRQVEADEQRVVIKHRVKNLLTVRPFYILSFMFILQFGLFLIGSYVYHYRFM